MVTIETPVFTRQITALLTDDLYLEFQMAVIANPMSGVVIPGTGGLRKIRWKGSGKGKRGGLRVIYYFHAKNDQLFLLLAYAKNQQEDLTSKQAKFLVKLVEQEFEK